MPALKPLLLLALFALPLGAAEVLPTPGKAVGVVIDDTPGSWAVVAQDFSAVEVVKEFNGTEKDGYLGCLFEGPAGRYLAIKSGAGKLKTFAVVLGTPAPGPVIPPAPPDPEVPPAPPTPAGPRQVLILRESEQDTPNMSILLSSLGAGKGYEYLKSKGHAYFNFDVDGKRPDGKPDPNVTAWNKAIDLALPAVAILDSKGNVLAKQNITPTTTADDVLKLLKQWEDK